MREITIKSGEKLLIVLEETDENKTILSKAMIQATSFEHFSPKSRTDYATQTIEFDVTPVSLEGIPLSDSHRSMLKGLDIPELSIG